MKKGGLQKKIPPELRNELANDPDMKVCCIEDHECEGYIQWHHHQPWQGGPRINSFNRILPVCSFHHSLTHLEKVHTKLDAVVESRSQ